MINFKVLSITVAASSTASTYWAPETDVRISKILITERSSTALDNVFVKIDKAGIPITREAVPASIFNVAWNAAIPFDFTLEKGVKLNFNITNNLTTDVNLDIIIIYE